jgi:hypothetical protein
MDVHYVHSRKIPEPASLAGLAGNDQKARRHTTPAPSSFPAARAKVSARLSAIHVRRESKPRQQRLSLGGGVDLFHRCFQN